MASTSAASASPSKIAGVRPRARFPKARPNVLGAERRSGTPAPSTPKPVAPTEDNEIKIPPPVRRMVRLDFTPPKPMAEPVPQPSVVLNNTADDDVNAKKTEPPERSAPPVQPQSPVTAVRKVIPEVEKPSCPQSSTVSKQRERKLSSRGGNENREREQAKRQRFKKVAKPPERSKMTMFDLIYWNPTSNPMTYEEDECRIPLSNKEANVPDELSNSERLSEEAVDDPENVEEPVNNEENEQDADKDDDADQDCMPVPQVKIGPDGRIVLDEQSLVIETSSSKKDLSSSPAIYERSSNVTYSSFRVKKAIKTWSDKETAKFYMALSSVGTDFSMMGNLFPKRSRNELKLKFKKEDKLNKALVDKAIHDHQQYDLSLFEESDEEVENLEDVVAAAAACKNPPKKGARKAKKKTLENKDASETGSKKAANKKRRQCLQEESDSDSEQVSSITAKTADGAAELATLPSPGVLPYDTDNPTCESAIPDGQTSEDQEYEVDIDDDLKFDNDDEECNDTEKILEGVLKQTRSGRQPKKKSLFTIDIDEPKRHRKKKLKIADLRKNKLAFRNSVPAANVHSVNAALVNTGAGFRSPNQLVFVTEEAKPDGSQIIHLYMLSPPSSTPKPFRSPLSEHDYSRQTWSYETTITNPTYILDASEVVQLATASSSAKPMHSISVQNESGNTSDLPNLGNDT